MPILDFKVLSALRQLAAERPLRARVTGQCMAPLLEHGALIEISADRQLWPGDVVAFQDPEAGLMVHRLLGYAPWKGRLCLVTRGDGMAHADRPVVPERVLGRVTGGECSPRLVRVPLADRLRALARLGLLALQRAVRR